MEPKLILKAELHNWSLIGPGDWTTTEWLIYDDGFFRIHRRYNPDWDALHNRADITSVVIKSEGILEDDNLQEIKRLIPATPWRDPDIVCDACDGVAWIIEAYDETGNIINSSGRLDYIYGHRVLEELTSLLPGEEIPRAPAFITIKNKIEEYTYVDEENKSEIIIGI